MDNNKIKKMNKYAIACFVFIVFLLLLGTSQYYKRCYYISELSLVTSLLGILVLINIKKTKTNGIILAISTIILGIFGYIVMVPLC